MTIVDPWVVATIGLTIVVVFLLALLVPRRPRLVKAPVTDKKLDAITARLDHLEQRQAKNDHDTRNIRMAMEAMPTQRQLSEVIIQVATMAGQVGGMERTLDTNGHSLRRIEDFLMGTAAETIVKTAVETIAKNSADHPVKNNAG